MKRENQVKRQTPGFAGHSRSESDAREARRGAPVADPAGDALRVGKYRDTVQVHLNHLPALFRTFTGLDCRVSWAPTWPYQWSEKDLPIRFPLCRCLMSRQSGTVARCRRCAIRHLKLTLRAGHVGHRFTCHRGVHNCWQPVVVRHQMVGLAFIQALDIRPANAQQAGTKEGADTRYACGGRACRAARRMTRAEFNRSSRLLQLIFEHAETLTVADLRQADLDRTQRALHELQTVARHLREDLNGLIPAVNPTVPVLQAEGHCQRLVHHMLDYISQNYARPVTLKRCAEILNHNPAYLSALFSQHVGLPFKAYLTEVRMEKARELLGDQTRNVSQVASAVGYASENRFRIAFKQATGLAPSAWRETLRMKSSKPPE